MADQKKSRPNRGADSEADLQNELRREKAEGADSIGDVASNRNLSGSATWETLPDGPDSSDATGRSDSK